MVVGLLQVVFYVSAVAALLAGGVGFTRAGLPGIAAWPLAWLLSAFFGLAMTSLLLSFPRMAQQYRDAPTNGATGQVFTVSELLIPYFIGSFLVGFSLPPILAKRQQNGLPPLSVPGWVVYAPLVIGFPLGIARLIFRSPQVEEELRRSDPSEPRAVAGPRSGAASRPKDLAPRGSRGNESSRRSRRKPGS